MRIYELGEGTPEVAVVGGIHGDEPCGVRAIERLLAAEPSVERPLKLIVANEEALEKGVRYVDEDLNRAFPGDAGDDTVEGRLATQLERELRGCTVLSMHSTQSFARPFALVDRVDAVTRGLCPALPIECVVETDRFTGGRVIEHAHTVEVECGLQGTDEAAANAVELVRSFLATTNVLPRPVDSSRALARSDGGELPVYRMIEPIPKRPATEYEVFAENFERVAAGERFAAADGDSLVADEPFYPVLLSPYGYQDIFGYVADRTGSLT